MKKWIILLCAFLASMGIVFVVLFTTSKTNYGESAKVADSLLDSKDVVSGVLGTKLENLSDFDAQKLDEYADAVNNMKKDMDELASSKACKDEKFAPKCEEAASLYGKLEQSADATSLIKKFVAESTEITGVSSNTLFEMKNSSNEFLKVMATELSEYRELVNEFSSKYGSETSDKDFVADYSKIDEKIQLLKEKYSEIKSEDLFGASDGELLSFYDKVEELRDLFAKEK